MVPDCKLVNDELDSEIAVVGIATCEVVEKRATFRKLPKA